MFIRLQLTSALLASALLQGQLQQPEARDYPARAEVIMSLVLARTPDIPAIKNTDQFADVPKGSWYEPYMLYAENIGIVGANAEKKLKPEASVTRAEFLKMLTATFNKTTNYPHPFSDIPSAAWYAPYAGLAKKYRLFILTQPTKLEPQRAITRAELTNAINTLTQPETQPVGISLEQAIAQDQSRGNLALYSVISTRRQNVTLVQPTPIHAAAPVRRISIPPSLPSLRTQVLTLVNKIRTEKNLSVFNYNPQLELSAQAYADAMIKEGFFGHTSPSGQVLKDRIAATGFYNRTFSTDCNCIKGYALGENLARGPKTAKEAVDAWMKSSDHRDAILNPDYTFLGVGVNAGIWVQHFGGVILPH